MDDAGRRLLHDGLIEQPGDNVADTLMEYLPHSGWPEFATHADVTTSAAELRAEMAKMKADLRAEIAKQTRTIVISIATMTITLVGSFTGLVASLSH